MNVITYTCQGCGEKVSPEGQHSTIVSDLRAAIMRDVDVDDRTPQEEFLVSRPVCTNRERPAEFVRSFPPLNLEEMVWLRNWRVAEAEWRPRLEAEHAKKTLVVVLGTAEYGKSHGLGRVSSPPDDRDYVICKECSKPVTGGPCWQCKRLDHHKYHHDMDALDMADEARKEQG